MAKWTATNANEKYGVVIYSYHGTADRTLPLTVGQTVYIEEETDGWYKGYKIKNKHERGIFPKTYVFIKEATLSGCQELIYTGEPPIVAEITSVLQEWSNIMYQLYENCDEKFLDIRNSVLDLMEWRSKILSQKMTVDELRDLKHKATSKIDCGNVSLKMDLVVRDDEGNIIDPQKTSTVKIYRQHVLAAKRIQENSRNSTEVEVKPLIQPTFGVYVMLRNFVCRIGEDADLLMNLYDEQTGNFISENYVVKWGKEGMPKDIDMLNNFRVVFTDLGSKDRQREKVFLLFQIVRIGTMDPRDMDNKKQTQGLRRPFGVAAMDVTAFIQGTLECNEDTQHFIHVHMCGEREFLETVIKKITSGRESDHKGQGVWVSIKVLEGDSQQIWDDYPHLVLPGTAISRKIGFPEVIMPVEGDVRNEIYITLMQGEFNKGSKTSEKNVEVTIQVCNQKGGILENVISGGAGGEMMSRYCSCIYYHEDRPKWFETVKVAISTEEEFRGLHLKFLFKHRSSSEGKDKLEKPFAMAFIKLMNEDGTTLKDTIHDLLIYKAESKKVDNFKDYFDFPSTRYEFENCSSSSLNSRSSLQRGGLIISTKDFVQIKTYVCSTKLTHNVNLLGLLKWQEILNDSAALKKHLEELMTVDGEEIVKFLQDLLDSLFSILMQNNNSDTYENLVFTSLTHIISLISDRKYQQFRPVLDTYITVTFSFAMAYSKLIVILKDYVDSALESNPTLFIAMKSLEYIMKFIIRSRFLFSIINDERGREQFEISLRQLFMSINQMMAHKADSTILVQGAALKYITTTIPDVISVFSPVELSKLLVSFFDAIPPNRLSNQKMQSINNLVHSKLFEDSACRHILLPMILTHTSELLNNKREMPECANVLSDIMDSFYCTRNVDDLSIMIQKIFRTVIQTIIQMDWNQSLVGNYVAIMMAILSQMTQHHYTVYINSFATRFDLLDFLTEILMILQHLITENVYKNDWNEMILHQNSIILRALRFFATTIKNSFSDPFEYELWNGFFFCAVSFLTQKPLQLEKFSLNKRSKIIARYKDMRREMGFEIRSMWFKLDQNKHRFIPDLVGKILEMTLIPETILRKATIPIFFDMMQCEFQQISSDGRNIKNNFSEVENQIVTQLDVLVEGGCGDEEYMELMYEILKDLFEKHKQMAQQGEIFVEMIRKLLQRLLQYRTMIQDEVKDHRMSCIVNLLNFYHEICREELYVRYLHKLCDLHLDCDNFTEAACALNLYANMLEWSDKSVPPVLMSHQYPEYQNQLTLKERLYYDMIDYFERGKMWEKGIELCKELANLYENELFDYEHLSELLKRQADLYVQIMKTLRYASEYFRVAYYGKGFPSFLQNQVYIYRGKEYERLTDFSARLLTMFPYAEKLTTLSTPGDDIKLSPKQYLQINAVTPCLDLKSQFKNKTVSESILSYYMVNEVQKFTYSRRMDDNVKDVKDMWLERTILVISHPLPGILRWFPVVSTEVVEVSPLETAIETLETTNKKLQGLIGQHNKDPSLRVDQLTMLLSGVVDPAVNKGILNYKEFYSAEFLMNHENDKNTVDMISRLKSLTLEQGALLRDALQVHKRLSPEGIKPLHAHMEHRFVKLCDCIEEECGLRIAEKDITNAMRRNQSSLSMSSSPRYSNSSIVAIAETSSHTLNHMPSPITKSNTALRSRSISCASVAGVVAECANGFPLKSKNRRTSQLPDASNIASSSQRNSVEQRLELNEQLTPKRPLRPDSERRNSRPASSQFHPDQTLSVFHASASSLCSNISNTLETPESTSDDSDFYGEPPPLPEKLTFADYTNTMGEDSQIVSHRLITTVGPKNKPPPPIPVEEEIPPVPRKPPLPR
eukprot:XP_014787426.1 PREDICTED: dedicator of cytokinesis protein 1-like isoform X1 [Octopus bimaculoides]